MRAQRVNVMFMRHENAVSENSALYLTRVKIKLLKNPISLRHRIFSTLKSSNYSRLQYNSENYKILYSVKNPIFPKNRIFILLTLCVQFRVFATTSFVDSSIC
jgi:hypothetical protein